MKKIITLLAVSLLLSCSKSDDSSLPVTFQNMVGKWKYKSIIKADGTVIPYVGMCATKTDYAEIFNYRKIVTYNYYMDCNGISNFGGSDYSFNSNNVIHVSSELFDEAKITNLTSSGFTLEFDPPKSLNFMAEGVYDAKALVFEKL
ncbi:hypothetical protein EZL74_08475 [Flavobacterium silvisoli]|uniref:Lipocalin-like domain-containing protein n=1 Tax=Flavobacterium silvisoli TaxID=2529433 RepID=A0A4Q9YX08_9FLAO|nr:hypothetical protein [Flavobacterium silvisoli]TBX68336.1 hypothetical protein EZL74_08475 [Flavobacterium silvisoli]